MKNMEKNLKELLQYDTLAARQAVEQGIMELPSPLKDEKLLEFFFLH